MKTPLLAALLALPGMAFAHDDGDRPVGLLERICAENEHVDDELDEVGFCSLSLEAQRRQLNKMMVTTRRLNNANRYYFDPAETGSRAHIQLKRPGMTRFRYRFTRFEYTGSFPYRKRRVLFFVDREISGFFGGLWDTEGLVVMERVRTFESDPPHQYWTVRFEKGHIIVAWGTEGWARGEIAKLDVPNLVRVVEGGLDCIGDFVEVKAFPEQCVIEQEDDQ